MNCSNSDSFTGHTTLIFSIVMLGLERSHHTLLLQFSIKAPNLFTIYNSGQNKVPIAELKSRLIVVQKSFDSSLIVVLWSLNGKSFPPTHRFSRCFFQVLKLRAHLNFLQHPPLFTSARHCCSRPNSLLVIHGQVF